MSRDIHTEVTAALVAAIEANPGDPVMPWHRGGASELPVNIASGAAYQGVNIVTLCVTGQLAGHASSVWGTYRQWRAAECQVRRGETAVPVVFYKQVVREEDGEDETFRVLKWFPVFNVGQVDGWQPPPAPDSPALPRLAAVDAAVLATGAQISEGGDRAFYAPATASATDSICMPDGRRFFDTDSCSRTENFYAVLLHELTHWTGHGSRCHRSGPRRGTGGGASRTPWRTHLWTRPATMQAHVPERRPDEDRA
jgi:antirestriction protein ArdC